MKRTEMDRIRLVGWIAFSGYLLLLMHFMFFSDLWGRTQVAGTYSYNLRPFQEILRFIRYHDRLGFWPVFLNLAGNVVGFMPFGFCVPLLDRYHRSWYVVFAETLVFSISIELLQLVSRVGSCDIDDVILNTLGGVLGYVLFMRVMKMRRRYRARRVHKK